MSDLHYTALTHTGTARLKKGWFSGVNYGHRRAFLIFVVCCLVMTAMTLAFSRSGASARATSTPTYQGVVIQVDATNPSNVTFSILDNSGRTLTFQLTAGTRFAPHQSASRLSVNTRVVVQAKAGKAGTLGATWVQLLAKNQAVLHLQGVVVAVDLHQKLVTLALSDGTVLAITISSTSIAHLQAGALIALSAKFAASGSLLAASYRVIAAHTAHFQARGIVSHLNTRVHLLTLVSPSGSSFSFALAASGSGSYHIGEKVNARGGSDSQGDLSLQSASVENDGEQYLTVIGIVSAIDSTGGTFSLLDKDGNSATLSAAPDLLASLTVGGIYQFEVRIASDGSLTAVKILSTQGDDNGDAISVEGTVQAYDTSSGLLNIATQDGQSYTALVNTQTEIIGCDGTPGSLGSLAAGEAIHAYLQVQPDGSYVALKIKIEECSDTGSEVEFAGFFLSYDSTSGQLIITTEAQSQLSFTTSSSTTVEGAGALTDITVGIPVKVTAQVQTDGSYLATQVQVDTEQDNLHAKK